MNKNTIEKEQICEPVIMTDLTFEEARELSQLPYKQPKADKDLIHDVDKLKTIPPDDGSLSILSTKRKRNRRT